MNPGALHSVSVAGVTFDDAGRVLVIRRRDNGQWQPPGGILELDETLEQGVAREVLEETGVRVRVERLTGVYKNMAIGVVALVFRCNAIDLALRLTEETTDVRWLDVAEATALMSPAFALRVSDATRPATEAPASRAHDGVDIL